MQQIRDDALNGGTVAQRGYNGAAYVTSTNNYLTTGVVPVTALATVATIRTAGAHRLNVEAVVTGAALTGFQILARVHPSGSLQVIASTQTQYGTPGFPLMAVNRTDGVKDLTTIPAGDLGYFTLDCSGFDSVVIKASSAGAADVTILSSVQ